MSAFRGQRGLKKISQRERQRMAVAAIRHSDTVTKVLLAVLGQSGGEVTITAGTLAQVGAHLDDLGYRIEPQNDGKEYVVKMVSRAEEAAKQVEVKSSLKVTTLPDDDSPVQESSAA